MKPFYTRALWLLLVVSFFLRVFRLGVPAAYVFDEVYHVPAVRAISQGNLDAYNPFAKAPEPNTAYDWLHPPLAKLIQANSVKIFGDNSFGWRFPSALFGTISIAALYYFALTLFKNKKIALMAAAFFAFDNLQLTMSRITMNDIFVTTWIIFALTFFCRFIKGDSFTHVKASPYRNLFLTAIFTGLAVATKHSAVLLFPIYLIFFLIRSPKKFLFTVYILLITVIIYFLSYSQLFLRGGSLTSFFDLHKQIIWYQTHLTATHSYQSSAWQWPFLIRPVWFYVEYFKNSVANIYNLGNPLVFWGGLISLIFCSNLFLLICYFFLFFPFVFSPRIMFLHHYLPALPFLCLILAQVVNALPAKIIKFIIFITIITFIFFYPLNTAIPLPVNLLKYWFWLPTWR
ncbi:MAG: glycosyltransferase family 39 protein [Candidatus Beckwithbacteria bacterium]|nr:glycosyltransferase family 39 protein [Candidatus Beckwithbacteria bacterium]